MRSCISMLLIAVLSLVASIAGAQEFPAKPLHLLVPFPPGGAADIMARLVAEQMEKGLGQPVVVDNKPGAGAVLAYDAGARSPADGYTILQVWPSFVINSLLRSGLNYEPLRDFKPVVHAVSLPLAIAVNPSIPAHNLEELVRLARAQPGTLSYSTPGQGTTQNFLGEMLNLAANVKLEHVPYSGGGKQVLAVAGGHVPAVIANVTEIAPLAQSGQVRMLTVFSAERVELFPDVQSIRETPWPQLETMNWAGFVVPANTPPTVVARLSAELTRALKLPEVREKLRAQGMYVVAGTPEQFGAFLRDEYARYGRVAKEAGIKIE